VVGGGGAGDLDQLLRGEQPEAQRQPRADAGHPGRYLREVVQHRQLVTVEPQVAVVGRVRADAAVAEAVEQRQLVVAGAERWGHHVAHGVVTLVV
jgi:hypothetical protein